LIELVGLLDEKALIVQGLYDVRHFFLLEPQHLRHLSHLFQTKSVLKRWMKNSIIFLSNVYMSLNVIYIFCAHKMQFCGEFSANVKKTTEITLFISGPDP
jgi:hypothetical protein